MRSRDDSGFLLVEVVISIALISMVILALAVGLLTAIRSSDAANRQQIVDSALSSASESIRSMPYPSSASTCPTEVDYQSAYDAYPEAWAAPGVVVTVAGIEHWDPTNGSYDSSCPGPLDPLVHRLTLEVDVGDDDASAQVVVGLS